MCSDPAEGNGFLRVIKISSTPSFREEVKLLAPCRKIVRFYSILMIPAEHGRYCVCYIQGLFMPTPFFATRCLYCNQRALVDESGMIRTPMGMHSRSENGCSAWDTLYNTIL
jgi:hypothetical protein